MDGEVPESCKASFHTPSLGLMAMFGDEDDADDDIENSEDCDICLIFSPNNCSSSAQNVSSTE